jgi:putative spermidine/putrescine transport system ATP-binding protein
MSDRIAIMKDGKIAQVGVPRELYEKPRNAFVAGFLGEANLFDVKSVKRDGNDRLLITTCEGLELSGNASDGYLDGAVVVCVRPEALTILRDRDPTRAQGDIRIPGRIQDVVFTAGTVRYRVATDTGARILVKLPSRRHLPQLDVGQSVTLACAPADILLIQKE